MSTISHPSLSKFNPIAELIKIDELLSESKQSMRDQREKEQGKQNLLVQKALESLSNLEDQCLRSKAVSSLIWRHQSQQPDLIKMIGIKLRQSGDAEYQKHKGFLVNIGKFRRWGKVKQWGQAKLVREVSEMIGSLFPLDIEGKILEHLFASDNQRDVENAMALIRQKIKDDPIEGYSILAEWINKNECTLGSLKLTDVELEGISVNMIHLHFGSEFDFTGWTEERIYHYIDQCEHLKSLTIWNAPISRLPPRVRQLAYLDCRGCARLNSLPAGMGALIELDCRYCPSLTLLPDEMKSLTKLDCRGSEQLAALPTGMRALVALNCNYCTTMNALPNDMISLKELNCRGCTALASLPDHQEGLIFLDTRDCIALNNIQDNLRVRFRI